MLQRGKKKGWLARFQQQEAESIATAVEFNRWSKVMIQLLIQEIEEKLLQSDQPVEPDSGSFWGL